jgi:hypothetical protein
VDSLDRLVDQILSQYRWGLHPLKMLAALLLPVLLVWLGDRRVGAEAAVADAEEKTRRRLPRIRRR